MRRHALCRQGAFLLPLWRGQGRLIKGGPAPTQSRGTGLTALRRRSRAKVGMGGIVFSMVWLSLALAGEPQHGLALGATVQYPPGFAHYAYAAPRAVQGGVLTLASPGS